MSNPYIDDWHQMYPDYYPYEPYSDNQWEYMKTWLVCPKCGKSFEYVYGLQYCPYCGCKLFNKQCCGVYWNNAFNYCPLCGKRLN